jgi:hypothetical protein
MLNKNIYFPNIFYKEWVLYLIPTIKRDNNYELQYYDYCSIKELSPRYNFKDNIFRLMDNLYNDENLYISILCKENIVLNNKILYFQINIIKSLNFFIENLIQYNLTKYIYEIPFNFFDNIKKNNNWNIKEFNNLITKIWNNYNGILMYDYICSDLITQIVYFYFFKKVIIRSIY